MAAVAILIGAGLLLVLSSGADDDGQKGSTVIDYAGREVVIPENLDNGIVTVGRLSTIRWLAYFPAEMEKVKMIDVGLKTSIKSGALAYSYAYHDILEAAETHSSDNLDDAENIVKLNPSLIIVNDDTYNAHKDACESLSRLFPLAVIDTMGDLEGKGFWDKDYKLIDRFVNQADLYGKLLRNEERGNEVKGIFQSAIDDIRANSVGESKYAMYIGGPMNQGANPLTSTYNPYPTLALVGGNNVMAKTSDYRIDQSPEDVAKLDFDCMVIDPGTFGVGKGSNKPQIYSTNSHGVLLDVHARNHDGNTANDVSIYITLPVISHGANWDCVLAGAYFMAHLNYDEMTYDEMMDKASSVFVSFYGERGEDTLDEMMSHYHANGMDLSPASDVQVFGEVKVSLVDGTYVLTS